MEEADVQWKAGGKEEMFSAVDLGWRKLEERREEVKVMFSAGDLGWEAGGKGGGKE